MGKIDNFDIRNPFQQFNDGQQVGKTGDADVGAGHVGKYISLANPDKVSQLSRHFPLAVVFVLASLSFIPAAMFTTDIFFLSFVILTGFIAVYCFQLVLCTLYGAHKIRSEVKKPWTSMWEEHVQQNPDATEGMFHIIMLPNYKEDEHMMSETIQNLAKSHMAKSGHVVVVLAMEAREGPDGKAKADRLIQKHGRDFKDMFATYHPKDIQGEIAGKSSNTQWAFREVQRWYGNYVSRSDERNDPSKVYLTIADADSILHEDYLTALSFNGANMNDLERSWSVWQSPILLLRNWGTVPGVVRNSAYVTFMFELSGLVASQFWEHCCFCTYSMSLALANHPIVDGWDADVIAEDHHMYMKCMFASYWEDIFATRRVNEPSRLRLRPIYLPVTGYIVEDPRGVLYTIYARFQQARRHAQGIAELSYCVLQYFSICQEMEGKMPLRAHLRILGLLAKYLTVEIILNFHSLMLMVMTSVGAYWSVSAYLEGNLFQKMEEFSDFDQMWRTPTQMAVMTLMNFFPFLGFFYIIAWSSIVTPCLQGFFCSMDESLTIAKIADKEGNSEHAPLSTCDKKMQGKEVSPECVRVLSWREWFRLQAELVWDCYGVAGISLILYGTVVTAMSVTSLSLYGHRFEYIVAAKPESNNKALDNESNENDNSTEYNNNVCPSPIAITEAIDNYGRDSMKNNNNSLNLHAEQIGNSTKESTGGDSSPIAKIGAFFGAKTQTSYAQVNSHEEAGGRQFVSAV